MTLEADGYAYPGTRYTKDGMPIGAGQGMTMRDWFAGKALGESTREIWTNHKPEDVAKRCYDLADAMLKERHK